MANKNSKTNCIKFSVSEEEEQLIRKNAKACDMVVSAYVREMALNMCVIPLDYSVIVEHTNQLQAYRNVVTQLVFTIIKSSQYMPNDLVAILQTTKELFHSENRFLDLYGDHVDRQRKIVESTVKKTVKKNLRRAEKQTIPRID